MNLHFRAMTDKDIPKVYKLECLLFSDPWPKKSFKTELRQKHVSFPFVVENENEIVGYIICWYYVDELHIGNIAVIPEKQHQGIGKYLLGKVLDYFVEYKSAFLEVRRSNKNAINLYLTFGFQAIYRRKAYYPNGEDALVMVKNRILNH
jgi:ribosomal-protein-alanine N-acetyltransferase